MPESMKGRKYYFPTEEGEEKRVRKRLEEVEQWKQQDEKEEMPQGHTSMSKKQDEKEETCRK